MLYKREHLVSAEAKLLTEAVLLNTHTHQTHAVCEEGSGGENIPQGLHQDQRNRRGDPLHSHFRALTQLILLLSSLHPPPDFPSFNQ